ncbi:TIR domain-containing protein [Paraburkholderia dipogonis]|uniref:TIR domain-containing protein n=1 Tax=Paraburkholderia dipogonis TaxID=1211383 RepID=UPI0038BB9FAD
MAARNGNYAAFYVAEPFSSTALRAHATPDFVYYNQLRMWKGADANFPFVDSHDKTYSVRDGSDWETTLKPRLRERLRASKNIVLFLSKSTLASKALIEEIDYGINNEGLPVIVVYPGFASKASLRNGDSFAASITSLWSKVPIFKSSMGKVPTVHIPLLKDTISSALRNKDFMLNTKAPAGAFYYKP